MRRILISVSAAGVLFSCGGSSELDKRTECLCILAVGAGHGNVAGRGGGAARGGSPGSTGGTDTRGGSAGSSQTTGGMGGRGTTAGTGGTTTGGAGSGARAGSGGSAGSSAGSAGESGGRGGSAGSTDVSGAGGEGDMSGAAGSGMQCTTAGASTCDLGDYCWFADHSCGSGDALGICATPPGGVACSPEAVCGCNGVAYRSTCVAYSNRVDVDGLARCVPGNGAASDPCLGDTDCSTGLKCCSTPIGVLTCTTTAGGTCPLTP